MKNIKNKNIKWWVGTMSFVLLFGAIIFFSYEKMCFVWKGVELEVTMEEQENSSLVKIYGKAEKAKHLTINGREIFIDKEGNFEEYVSILSGYSIVEVKAIDQFGKIDKKEFKIIREKNAEAIAFEKNININ